MRARDSERNEDDDARRWFELAEERMMAAIYARRARFIQRSGEVDNDLVTFGTGVLFIGEARELDALSFRSLHLKDVALAENADGDIDTVFVSLCRTARQAAQAWGADNLGEKTQEALRQGGNREQKISFLHAVQPRADRDPRRRLARHLPFASTLIDVESEHIVAGSGFHEFPYAVPRWETAADEVYGRAPAMLALADARTLQQMGKTLLVAGQKAVDPPFYAFDDAVIGTPRTFPGGITYIDAQAATGAGMAPFGPLNMGANIPLGREMQNDVRDQIWQAFFRNVLALPVAGPQMTATEILERKEEFIRTIGPVFGQLEADYIGAVVERVFNLLMRAGALPEPPDILRGAEIQFDFVSPVQRARKQIEAAGAARAIELLAPFVNAEPQIMDRFDGDAIAEAVPEIFGTPLKWLRDDAAVEQIRAARATTQQAQAALAAGGQMADIAAKTARIPDAGGQS